MSFTVFALALTVACVAHAYQDSGVKRVSFWPMLSKNHLQGDTPMLIDPSNFVFKDITTNTTSNISDAIAIYSPYIFPAKQVKLSESTMKGRSDQFFLSSLEIWADDPTARVPQPEVDESFTLTIPSQSATVARLAASTYSGVIRGLETFSQLVIFGVVSRQRANSKRPN